jgi:hypothetical protein
VGIVKIYLVCYNSELGDTKPTKAFYKKEDAERYMEKVNKNTGSFRYWGYYMETDVELET